MNRRITSRPSLEALEDRLTLSGPSTAQDALVAIKGGPTLGAIYQEYEAYQASGGTGTFSPAEAGQVYFRGTSLGVDIRFGSGDFNTLVGQLKGIGLQVTATVPSLRIVEGYLPIGQLPTIAANSHESSMAAIDKPVLNSQSGGSNTPTPLTSLQQAALSQKAGTSLASIYQEYVAFNQSGGTGTFTSNQPSQIYFSGTSVGVDIRTSGDMTTLVNQLKSIGMRVTATTHAGQVNIIEGYLPIAQLPTVSGNSHVVGLSPVYKPTLN